MTPPFTILWLAGCPVGEATARTLQVLLSGTTVSSFSPHHLDVLPAGETLLIVQALVSPFPNGLLRRLRAAGFTGPILLVTTQSLLELRRRYRVLKFVTESSAIWHPSEGLSILLERTEALESLPRPWLEKFQAEIRADACFVPRRVLPCLAALGQGKTRESGLVALRDLIARAATLPHVCHEKVALGSVVDSITGHLERLSLRAEIEKPLTSDTRRHLEEVFTHWVEIALALGEEMEPSEV